MLITSIATSADSRRRPGRAATIRTLQRRLHLLAGLALVAFVYATPAADSPLAYGVRWVAVPLLVGSGIAMWQQPRLRRLAAKRRGSR